VKRAFLLVAHPVKGADLISSSPVWIGQCLFLVGIGLLIHITSFGRIVQLTMDRLPDSATPADRQVMSEILNGQQWVSAALFPFRKLAGFGGTALILFLALRGVTSGSTVHLKEIFALEVHAETVLLLGNLAAYAAVFMGSQQNPYVNPLGVSQLVEGKFDHISALNSINLFTLWYISLLVLGASRMLKLSYWKSIAAVLSTWVLMLVMEESSFDLLRNFFHF